MAALIMAVKGWVEQPLRADQDLIHWTLFFGMVIGIMFFWGFILRHMED